MIKNNRTMQKQVASFNHAGDDSRLIKLRIVIFCRKCITKMLLTEHGFHFCPECAATISVHSSQH